MIFPRHSSIKVLSFCSFSTSICSRSKEGKVGPRKKIGACWMPWKRRRKAGGTKSRSGCFLTQIEFASGLPSNVARDG